MLDVPAELLRFLAGLLAAERRRRATPAGSRKLACRDRAVLALRWFRDGPTPMRALYGSCADRMETGEGPAA